MPFNIGAPELIIILIIALIVLGPGKLPDVAQSLGKSVREFRKAVTDVNDAANPNPAPGAPAAPGAVQPNSLTGEAAPNTLGGTPASPTSPTSGDDSPAAPAS